MDLVDGGHRESHRSVLRRSIHEVPGEPVRKLGRRSPGVNARAYIRRAAAVGRGGAGQLGRGAVVIADVGCRIHIAIGVIEIEPIVFIRQQHRAKAHNPAVINMVERAFVRVIASCDGALVVVRVVMPFPVVKGARERRPGLRPVHRVHSVVLRLPRTDRSE